MANVESFTCIECGAGLFYFFSIDKEIHTLCRSCGYICILTELISALRKEKKRRKVKSNV